MGIMCHISCTHNCKGDIDFLSTSSLVVRSVTFRLPAAVLFNDVADWLCFASQSAMYAVIGWFSTAETNDNTLTHNAL